MSRKTISFQNQPKDPAMGSAPKKRVAPTRSRKAAAIDEWVQEAEPVMQEAAPRANDSIPAVEMSEASPPAAAIAIEPVGAKEAFVAPKAKTVPTIGAAPQAVFSLSAQPDPFEAFKVVFMLPSLACFYWSFGAAQKNMRFWAR